MRSVIVALFLMVATPVVNAQSRAELAEEMKVIGGHFRTVAIALRTGSIDDSTISAASELVVSVRRASEIMPATAPDEGSQERYTELMQELIVKAEQLFAAVEAGDFATTSRVFREMNEVRILGHDEFKPDEN